ncbi:NAD kinase [subsurface metagenome]
MKRVGILYHPRIDTAYALAKETQQFLTSAGVSVWLYSAWDEDKARSQVAGTDLILSIGGDGTILQAVRVIAPGLTPITGINLGRLGFLNELSSDEAVAKLPALLAGEGWIDERAMLEAELSPMGEGSPQVFYALNDVVVARGAIARAIYIEASIDGEPLTTYKGDGIIVATATGSTGYSLSAGGPVLHPQAKEFLLLPILPHLTSTYPLVLPPAAEVKLRTSTTHQAMLSIDGRLNLPLSDGAMVTVKLSSNTVRFLRIHPRISFYNFLDQRLKGKR